MKLFKCALHLYFSEISYHAIVFYKQIRIKYESDLVGINFLFVFSEQTKKCILQIECCMILKFLQILAKWCLIFFLYFLVFFDTRQKNNIVYKNSRCSCLCLVKPVRVIFAYAKINWSLLSLRQAMSCPCFGRTWVKVCI